ncbi:MAG TPA: DUF1684 domain-containing protein [Candidatus Limnocylindrales bacterium]|nr:DUF1684 domain-containing protein [Candidatus Limnocylindrales bacterium]
MADGGAAGRLDLADWRRRVAELYAEVRALAGVDPLVAWHHWVEIREWLYREHPQSPLPVNARRGYRARHFEYDGSLRFEVAVEPAPPAPGGLSLALPNSGDDALSFERIGSVEIPFTGGPRRLSLFWMAGYSGGLFLPFRDATNGAETYGAGRYLIDSAKSADLGGDAAGGTLVVDFNFGFQPSCAFDPKWACPLAPPENRLDIGIRAGERMA